MNYHTAKMVASKHGKRCVRDTEDHRFYFEERDGTPIFDCDTTILREMTSVALEIRLGIRFTEPQP